MLRIGLSYYLKNNVVSGFLIINSMLYYLLKCGRDAGSHGALCFGV